MSKWRALIEGAAVLASGGALFVGHAIYTGNERFYREVVMPAGGAVLEPETAHRWSVWLASKGLLPYTAKRALEEHPRLVTRVFDLNFRHPIGLAAGFDKDGQAVPYLLEGAGFAFVEVGSVTPLPQPGNERPRLFRLAKDRAVINRFGFNSDGHEAVLGRLTALREGRVGGVLGVNLGKNKQTAEATADYTLGIQRFAGVADYLVINISSPNTPGLRTLQKRQHLTELLKTVVATRNSLPPSTRPPLLVKISPDLSDADLADLCAVVLSGSECSVDGLIVTNTTTARPPDLRSPADVTSEVGGLSGQPLTDRSTEVIRKVYRLTGGKLPIVGVGGVSSGQQALEKLRAGASLVQLYTALTFEGPPLVERVCRELDALLEREGENNVRGVVGSDHRAKAAASK